MLLILSTVHIFTDNSLPAGGRFHYSVLTGAL
jgi:hypothetical protein